MSFLTGVSLIRNGNTLKYPWQQSLISLSRVCDRVLLNIGDSTDNTRVEAEQLAEQLGNVDVFYSTWDMSNTGDGRELANQANVLLPFVKTPWVLYLQADELVHENDAELIRQFLRKQPSNVSQVELFRTYFWGSLDKRAPAHELWLGRIFKAGTHRVGGDGMHLVRQSGDVARSDFLIYHYSRMGKEEDVTKRIRTLDLLFHPREEVLTYKPFSYSEQSNLAEYKGTHPFGIREFYK